MICNDQKIAAVIPARLGSTRFPNKVLFPFFDLPMIEHVRRRALLVEGISDVFVATCDNEIVDLVESFNGKAILTGNHHKNGTTRVSEAIENLECSHVILLQGDEPLLVPKHVSKVIEEIQKEPHVHAFNATGPLENLEELDIESYVKCAVNRENKILYCFRRSPSHQNFEKQSKYIQKLFGIIAYRKDFLLELCNLPEGRIENFDSIEQMRIIENGYNFKSILLDKSLPSVNTTDDADLVIKYLNTCSEQQSLLKKTINIDIT